MNKIEYLLVTVMEECAEIQKECSKCLRFGLSDRESDHKTSSVDELTNQERLNNELNDLMGVLNLLYKEGVVDIADDELIQQKENKVLKWMEKSPPYLNSQSDDEVRQEAIILLKKLDDHARLFDGDRSLPHQKQNTYPTKNLKKKISKFLNKHNNG